MDKNGTVIDGKGGPAVKAEVFIKGDLIHFVGKLNRPFVSRDTLDAKGKIVSPGFIDSHSHGDPFKSPKFINFTSMGVTTIALGQDGSSVSSSNFEQWLTAVDTLSLGPNIAPFIGHGTVRKQSGIGYKIGPTKNEIRIITGKLRQFFPETISRIITNTKTIKKGKSIKEVVIVPKIAVIKKPTLPRIHKSNKSAKGLFFIGSLPVQFGIAVRIKPVIAAATKPITFHADAITRC